MVYETTFISTEILLNLSVLLSTNLFSFMLAKPPGLAKMSQLYLLSLCLIRNDINVIVMGILLSPIIQNRGKLLLNLKIGNKFRII